VTAIDKPLIALPLAFLSHFALDVLPHFGIPGHEGFSAALKHRITRLSLVLDFIFGLILLAVLVHYSANIWTYLGAFLAVSPDFEWLFSYIFFERRGKSKRNSKFGQIHSWIQWGERPWGIAVEAVWFLLSLNILVYLLK